MKIDSDIEEELLQQLLKIQKATLKGVDQLMAIPQSWIVEGDYKLFNQRHKKLLDYYNEKQNNTLNRTDETS